MDKIKAILRFLFVIRFSVSFSTLQRYSIQMHDIPKKQQKCVYIFLYRHKQTLQHIHIFSGVHATGPITQQYIPNRRVTALFRRPPMSAHRHPPKAYAADVRVRHVTQARKSITRLQNTCLIFRPCTPVPSPSRPGFGTTFQQTSMKKVHFFCSYQKSQ